MVKTIDPANPIAIVIHDKCRCGRLAVWLRTYGGNADYPGEPRLYCRACEYGPVETCDCAPEAAAQEQGVRTMLEAQSLEYLNRPCGTCHHRRGVHFKTYDGSHAGCIAETGRDHPITCPCEGYMTTESETLRMEYLAEVGRRVFRDVVARQDAEHGPLYRKAAFP